MRAVDLGKSQLNGVINAREQAAREGQPNLADRDEEIRGFQKCIDLLERAEAMIRAPSGLDPATYLGGYDAALVRLPRFRVSRFRLSRVHVSPAATKA